MFTLRLISPADQQLEHLKHNASLAKQYRAVTRALTKLAQDPRHPGLQTHAWQGASCPHGDKMFEA